MATLGQQLKAAREAKGVDEQEAGVATRILTKTIVAMEADDFSGMAAPTYAKGFIRLYAGYLGLDPEPLVEEYIQCHAPPPKRLSDLHPPQNKKESPEHAPAEPASAARRFLSTVWPKTAQEGSGASGDTFEETETTLPPKKDIRVLAGAAAGVIVLVVLIVSLSNCARRHAAAKAAGAPAQAEAARTLLDEPLPDLYLVEPGKIESK